MSYGYCERCNWRCDADDFRTEWTGLRVCPDCFDPRPSNLSPPRVKPEGVPLLKASPEPAERNLSDNEVTPDDL